MVTSDTSAKPVQSRPRIVHLELREGGVVDGGVYLTDGQVLSVYLGSRKGGWVNVVGATWLAEGMKHNHAVLQADHILFASSPDADVVVHASTKTTVPRSVDISLEDGTRVQGMLALTDRQRLSDYLSWCGRFLPVLGATRLPSGDKLGDIALNSACVKAVRDARAFAPGTMLSAAEEKAEWGGLLRSPSQRQAPVNREVVQRASREVEVFTPGRIPDRRTGKQYAGPGQRQTPPYIVAPGAVELTPQERALADQLAHHWLMSLGAAVEMLPPDPRELSQSASLEEIWRGFARRNDIAEADLAVRVASAFKLDVANLDDANAEALRIVPEKLAKKLGVLPLKVDDKVLTIAVSDPGSMEIEQQLGFVTKLVLRFVVAPPAEIRAALVRHYGTAPKPRD